MHNQEEGGEDRVAKTGKKVGRTRQPMSGNQSQNSYQPKILTQLHPEPDQDMWTKFALFFRLISTVRTSPVPISIDGQLLTTEELNPRKHQILFRKRGDYAMDVFHHVHIPINLNKIFQTADKAMDRIQIQKSNSKFKFKIQIQNSKIYL